jgi:hypothetical protein
MLRVPLLEETFKAEQTGGIWGILLVHPVRRKAYLCPKPFVGLSVLSIDWTRTIDLYRVEVSFYSKT